MFNPIRCFADADAARKESADLLNRIVESVGREGDTRREIDELRRKLPKLESLLADQEKATGLLKAERRLVEDEIAVAEALLRGQGAK